MVIIIRVNIMMEMIGRGEGWLIIRMIDKENNIYQVICIIIAEINYHINNHQITKINTINNNNNKLSQLSNKPIKKSYNYY